MMRDGMARRRRAVAAAAAGGRGARGVAPDPAGGC